MSAHARRRQLIEACEIDRIRGAAPEQPPLMVSVDEHLALLEEAATLRARLAAPCYQANRKLSRWVARLQAENDALRGALARLKPRG